MAVEPKSKLNFRMTDGLRERAQRLADAEGVSLNTVLVQAVENYLPWRERGLEFERRAEAKAAAKRAALLLPKVGVNQPCPCGSGQKYKRCHGKPGVL